MNSPAMLWSHRRSEGMAEGDKAMRRNIFRSRRRLAGIALLTAALALGACASSNSYMGVPLAASAAHPGIRQIALRAQAGDKRAQMHLGMAYQLGLHLPVDWQKAKRLYRQAAASTGGTMWVYSPPVGKGTSGRVIPVNRGPVQRGDPAAAMLLERLEMMEKAGAAERTAPPQEAIALPAPLLDPLQDEDVSAPPPQADPPPAPPPAIAGLASSPS